MTHAPVLSNLKLHNPTLWVVAGGGGRSNCWGDIQLSFQREPKGIALVIRTCISKTQTIEIH